MWRTGASDNNNNKKKNKFLIFCVTFHPVHASVISESKIYNLISMRNCYKRAMLCFGVIVNDLVSAPKEKKAMTVSRTSQIQFVTF